VYRGVPVPLSVFKGMKTTERLAFNRFSMKFDNAFQVYLDAYTYTTCDGKELYTKLFYD